MTSVSSSQDLDSSFVQGLRLLHSSDPDAEEQLQQLWRQSVLEKYGSERTPTSMLHKIILPSPVKRENPEVIDESTIEVKRSKLDNPESKLRSQLTEVEDKPASEEEGDSNDARLEILTSDSFCVKCKTSTSLENNKLVECVDCQKHYHQLCHFPPITDMDLNDPRFVWYCATCEENINTSTSDKGKKSGNVASKLPSTNATKTASVPTKITRSFGSNNKVTAKSSLESGSAEKSNLPNSSERKGHSMIKRSLNKHKTKSNK